MKVSIFLMFIGIEAATANPSQSQNAGLTLTVHNKALKDVFGEIEAKSDYIFFYNDDAVNVNKRVNLEVEEATVSQILEIVLDKTSKYRVENRQVIIYKDNSTQHASSEVKAVQQAKITVTGNVSDSEGETLTGASVTEKGTTNATFTDLEGNYSIAVQSTNSVLVFTYIGCQSISQTVGNQKTVNVVLEPESSKLDEVMVVGYGTQRKSSITGSISSLNTDKMKDITSPNVANMLQGKIAGVSVSPESGQPGSAPTIRIRGAGSIRGTKDPLWVVDGVVGVNSADINPNDIENISVLKDGSATALYGSRGANGVILVTTKRATLGSSQIEVSARLGVSQLQRGNQRMMNGSEYYEYAKTAFENNKQPQTWLQPYLADRNFDWFDFSTQNAMTQNYNISYRYGTDRIRSFISGDYYNEEGTIKGYKYDRYSLRVNTDYIVNKRLTLKSKLSTNYRETDNKEYSLVDTSYSPWDTPYNSKGKIKTGNEGQPTAEDAPTADPNDYWYSDGSNNFLYNRGLNWEKGRRSVTDIGVGLDFKVFDFLTFESNNSFGFAHSYTDRYTDPYALGQKDNNGKVEFFNTNTRTIYTSQLLRILKTFDEKHEINAFLGYDYDEKRYQNPSASASNIFPGAEVLLGGASNYTATGGKTEEMNAAIFFNGNYSYDSKYLFQLSGRRDGSSRFGKNKRWASFWSVGAGWNMHQEEFIKQFSFINELKPRISYGTTGSLPPGTTDWATTYSIDAEYGGDPAYLSNYRGNPNLSWEETKSLDMGLDFRIFNRVGVTFDYYSKKVTNLIYLEHLSAVTGFNRRMANDGNLENKGYEITITPELIRTKDLYWDVSFNMGYNKNKITKLPKDNYGGNQIEAVGYAISQWYMAEWAGVDSQTGVPLWFNVDEVTGEKTAISDYSQATKVIFDSSPTPKYTGGISTSVAWKGLSLNANFTFSSGAKIYNGARAGSLDRDAERPTQPPMRLAKGWSRWEKPGDIATHPQLISGGNNQSSSPSSRYLESGDFFKMKSFSLVYSLPKRWISNMGISYMGISVGGENLFTITKFSGQDPEVLLSSKYNGNTSRSDGVQTYPTIRRFTVGLNLKF